MKESKKLLRQVPFLTELQSHLLLVFAAAAVFLSVTLFLSGCGGPNFPEPGTDAIEFMESHFEVESAEIDSYLAIEFEGRVYIPYGTIGKTIHEEDIDKCVGYIVQAGRTDKDERIYTLVEDSEHNYLMNYYIATTLMNSPMFFRAIDTVGRDIATPSYIHSLEYDFWK